ncbi:MLP-like protein 423 [Linum grandiflorum]
MLNNKYVVGVRYRARSRAVIVTVFCAAGDAMVEDQSNPDCTLFSAVNGHGDGGRFGEMAQFQHLYGRRFMGFSTWNGVPLLTDVSSGRRRGDDVWVCDWEAMPMPMVESANYRGFEVRLPRYVAIKSRLNGKYLRYVNQPGSKYHGFLQCSEDKPSQFAKFEIEEANSTGSRRGGQRVHVKCCYNDKYWVVRPGGGSWIEGGASRKEENVYRKNCTVFKVTYVEGDPEVVRIQDQLSDLNYYVCLIHENDGAYQAMKEYGTRNSPLLKNGISAFSSAAGLRFTDLFTFVDWGSVRDPESGGSASGSGSKYDEDEDDVEVVQPRPKPTGGQRPKPTTSTVGKYDDDYDEDETRPRPKPTSGQRLKPPTSTIGTYDNDDDEDEAWPRPKPTGGQRPKPTTSTVGKYDDDDDEARPRPRPNKVHDNEGPKEQRYEESFVVVSPANVFWGALFASTDLLPKADRDVYSTINILKGDGFTERSVRQINFVRGTNRRWKDWVEQIIRVDHEKKTIELSAVRGGPLNECGIFKTAATVRPMMSNPNSPGAMVKWTCRYTNSSGGFQVKDMKDLVESSFRKLDNLLLRDAERVMRKPPAVIRLRNN